MTRMRKTKKSKRELSNGGYEDWRPGRTFEDLELPDLPEAALSAALELLKIENDTDTDTAQLSERLRLVIRDYWVDRRAVVERPPAVWYRSKVKAICKATDDLLVLIRERTGTGLSQLRIETLRSMGRALRGGGPESIERLLEDFSAACRRCRFSAQRGAIAHTHLRSAVTECWQKSGLNILASLSREISRPRTIAGSRTDARLPWRDMQMRSMRLVRTSFRS